MNDESLELLRRIAKDVADIKAAMAASVGASAVALGMKGPSSSSGGAGAVANDAELDGQYGDPQIRNDPRRWAGESFVGCKFSETTPEYLDCYAEFKEWQAGKDEASGAKDTKGRSKANWAWKDARLARGWAARLRAGWKTRGANAPANSAEDYDTGGDDEIPF